MLTMLMNILYIQSTTLERFCIRTVTNVSIGNTRHAKPQEHREHPSNNSASFRWIESEAQPLFVSPIVVDVLRLDDDTLSLFAAEAGGAKVPTKREPKSPRQKRESMLCHGRRLLHRRTTYHPPSAPSPPVERRRRLRCLPRRSTHFSICPVRHRPCSAEEHGRICGR